MGRDPGFQGDLAIWDGRVVVVGRLAGEPAARTIDADGPVFCAGFVDMHTHPGVSGIKQAQLAHGAGIREARRLAGGVLEGAVAAASETRFSSASSKQPLLLLGAATRPEERRL
jgi:predicted amidohydrolase YtcJ